MVTVPAIRYAILFHINHALLLASAIFVAAADDNEDSETVTNQDTSIGGVIGRLVKAYSELPLFQRIFIACVAVALVASLTGLDGINSRPNLKEIPLEDAKSETNPRVFFDIEIGGEKIGRIVLELFANQTPKTAENFRCLATGERGVSKNSGKRLSYKGSAFHRIIPGFMLQGGDFTRGNGTGGESIYGSRFDDEWTNGYIAHKIPGLLSSANAGPNTNGSQFFLTVAPTKWLDGRHVVFGVVASGYDDVVKKIETVGSSSGMPSKRVVIADCGEIKKEKVN